VVPSSSSSTPAAASASGSSAPAHGGESEELLFFSLVQLMSDRKHNLRSLYSDDCVGLRLILSVFGAALDECDPPLSEHLRSQGVDVSLYATPWFVSCFAYRFSLPFTSACFGHFVNVGLYFLVLCALHVLRHLRPALLSKPFDLLVPFLTMGALADLPADLPDQAFAQGSLPDHLMQRLQPKHTRQSSYKVGRVGGGGGGGGGRATLAAGQVRRSASTRSDLRFLLLSLCLSGIHRRVADVTRRRIACASTSHGSFCELDRSICLSPFGVCVSRPSANQILQLPFFPLLFSSPRGVVSRRVSLLPVQFLAETVETAKTAAASRSTPRIAQLHCVVRSHSTRRGNSIRVRGCHFFDLRATPPTESFATRPL